MNVQSAPTTATVRTASEPPRSVFIYSMNFTPELIGVGRYSGELAGYLSRLGTRVEVVTSAPHYPGWTVRAPYRASAYTVERGANLRVTRCPIWLPREMKGLVRLLTPLSFALLSAPVAAWRIVRHRPETVLVVEPTLFAAPIALLAALLVGARTVLHVQDLEVDAAFAVGHLRGTWARRIALAFERWLLRKFDAIVTISARMQAKILEKGVDASRIAIVRNWVDLKIIQPENGHNEFRSALGYDDGAFVVLYAGNIGAKQSLHLLLDAAEKLAAEKNVRFVIAGEGPEKRGLMERGLPNVLFLPVQPEEKLCALLNMADLHVILQNRGAADLVLPSKLGGMLASGRAVLVTAEEGTELHNYLQGAAHLIPPEDSVRLADTIRELVKRQQEGGRIGNGSGLTLAAELDTSVLLPRFAELLKKPAPGAQGENRKVAGNGLAPSRGARSG